MTYQFNSKDILITQLGEEGVAFNSVTNEYYSLNETSFKILKGIENNIPIVDIRSQLEKEYEIEPAACEQAVKDTLQLFLSKKLITEV